MHCSFVNRNKWEKLNTEWVKNKEATQIDININVHNSK